MRKIIKLLLFVFRAAGTAVGAVARAFGGALAGLICGAMAGAIGGVAAAHAAFSPISLNMIEPAQFPKSNYSITGVRISAIVGKHRDLFGLDVGLVGNITEKEFTGVALSGVFNWTQGPTRVLFAQLAGGLNCNLKKTTVYGVQLAGLMNVNRSEAQVMGLQMSLLANLSDASEIQGAQLSIYNSANEVYGVQIGIVNRAKTLKGVQIGIINFNEAGPLGVSPLINIGF